MATAETTSDRTPVGSRLTRHSTLVLVVVLTCQLMVTLDATVVNIALPQIRDALGFSTANLSWVINAYTLTFGGLLLLGARAGDILGRRRVFIWGIALFTAASMLGGGAQNPAELLVARSLQGVGGALASPAALALLMFMFAEGRERTRAIGLYAAVSVGGSAVGLIAGGMLTQWVSWRWVLFINVPIGIFVFALGRLVLPETTRVRGVFDLTGALTSTIGMGALVFGFVRAASDGWSNAPTILAFVVGIVLLTAFVFNERRAASPITPLRLFTDRNRAASYLGRLFLVAGMFGMFFFLTQFLQNILGYSPVRTGVAFLPLTIMLFASSQVSSRYLVERFNGKALMVVGITLSTTGLAWLTQISATTGYIGVLGPLMLFGTGNGLAFVPLTTAALTNVEPEEQGAASGLVNVMQQVGGALGLAILVTVFGAASRRAGADPSLKSTSAAAKHAYVVGVDRAFTVATGFLFIVLLLVSFAIGDMPKHERPSAEEELTETLEAAGAFSATASG
jgi:EmrB/QacA subfamily drug resistance transporter